MDWLCSVSRWVGLDLLAKIPPWIEGWSVLTRPKDALSTLIKKNIPSSISGKHVSSSTLVTFVFVFSTAKALPPVDAISYPSSDRP